MKQLDIGIIGCGNMGKRLAKATAESYIVKLRCIADVEVQKTQPFASEMNARFYDNYEEMLISEHLDAVIIATPEPDHRDPVEKACAAGCHVFLEKPIATTLQDGQAIIDACASAGRKLMIGYILRFEPAYACIEETVRSGKLGRFLYAYARRLGSVALARQLGDRVTVTTFIAVHDIDQILWYHKVPAKSVTARAVWRKDQEETGTFDLAVMLIRFEDGALATIETGWALPEAEATCSGPAGWLPVTDYRMDVLGTKGRLWLDFLPMNLVGMFGNCWRFPDTRIWPSLQGETAGAQKSELEHFFNCIRYDRAPLVTGESALRSLEVVLAAEQSIEERREILVSSVTQAGKPKESK